MKVTGKTDMAAVRRLLQGKRNHWGPFEHPQISFNVCNFPHDVMQQARTHRVGCSFDVQSGRYTGQRIIDVATGDRSVEEVFYFRPVGKYTDREGKKYTAHAEQRSRQISRAMQFAHDYALLINDGWAEEHARANCPYAIREHFVVSFSMRALVHLLCVRGKLDAQLEIQELGNLLLPHFKEWAPQIGNWYEENLHTKAILAP
jgi:thymidylate synthase (FAD)